MAKRVLVSRLDQLGDIVQSLPFLFSLRHFFPDAEIHFLTTPTGAELLSGQGCVDRIHVWNCPWFDRTRQDGQSVYAWMKRLREFRFDCAFELRGDVRLIALMKMAGVKNIIGFGATGGGFLLDVEVPWKPHVHAVDKNLLLLEALDAPILERVPRMRRVANVPTHDRPAFAIHPDAGTAAKRWPIKNTIRVINELNATGYVSCALVGLNAKMGGEISAALKFPIDNRMGKTNLKELIEFLNGCAGLLSNDSGPAHLMAALGKPVWIVWSGTADKSVWAPRGDKVTLFDFPVPCAPCSLSSCPVDGHPCLTGIRVEDVLHSITSHFQMLAPQT